METPLHTGEIAMDELLCDLPIRDGNIDKPTTTPTASSLCDLPIRDGNSKVWRMSAVFTCLCDLPIRDGN